MQWHKKPALQLAVMTLVMSVVFSLQSSVAHNVFNVWKQGNYAEVALQEVKQNSDLVKVAAATVPACPDNASAIEYALTENNKSIAPPKRMRYVDAPWEYDSLNTAYFSRTSVATSNEFGNLEKNTTFKEDGEPNDAKINNILSSMFQYKPAKLSNAYVLKYSGAPRGNDTPHKGIAPAIEVPSKAGYPICAPTTAYDIGGGFEAMIVSADADRVTLHIGIHEYMDGTSADLGGCPGGACKGGYWIYISGIDVDPQVMGAYNAKRDAQRSSSLDKDISTRIQLPVIKPGRKLGTSKGNGVIVAMRDSGPLITLNEPFMWGGYPERADLGGTGTTGATTTPTPSVTVTPPPAGTQCFTLSAEIFVERKDVPGFYRFHPHIKAFSPQGGKDGDIMASFLNNGSWINNGTYIQWNKGVQNPIDIDYSKTFYAIGARDLPSQGVTELSDNYKLKIDNCAPLPNEATIVCKMGIRNDVPFVESVSGGECKCMGEACTAPQPAQASPSPEPSSEPSPPAETSPSPPPEESTLPTGGVSGTTVVIKFNTCNNSVCQRLKEVAAPEYNGRWGRIYWDGGSGDMYKLGSDLSSIINGEEHIFHFKTINTLPEYSQLRNAYLLLTASDPMRYYITR